VYLFQHIQARNSHDLHFLTPQAEGSGRKERFVLSVAFSPDRQLLAAGAMDGTVAVWDVAAGGQLLHIGGLKGHHKPVRSLAFTPGACANVDGS
jgi:WD40 repeat protein